MTEANRGGSLLKFTIITVILAAALVGTIYGVRQNMSPQPTPSISKPSVTDKDKPAKKDNPVEPSKEQSRPPAIHEAAPIALPQTGPAETLSSLLAVGLLSMAIVAYFQSRRLESLL